MEDNAILDKIKSGPYWRVNIRPYDFEEKIASLSDVLNLVDQCKVSLRGWTFPHVDISNTYNGQDFVQSECNSGDVIEYWRFFKSGQFVHYFSVYEDLYMKSKQERPSSMWETKSADKPSGYLGITTTIYRMTEIYEFAMRLAQKGIYNKGMSMSISLSGIMRFKLFYFEAERVLFRSYVSMVDEIKLESKFSLEELLAKGHDEAIKKCIQVFEIFNWIDSPKVILIEDQKKFLERRI